MPNNLYIITFLFLLLSMGFEPNTAGNTPKAVTEREEPRMLEPAEEIVTSICGAEVRISKTTEALEGYNLFVLGKTDKETLHRHHFMLIVDVNGEVLLEEYLGVDLWLSDCPAEFINPMTILVALNNSAAIHSLADGSMTPLPFAGHHEYEYNPLDDTFFILQRYELEIDEVAYQYDTILEFDRYGNVVWSFDTASLINVSQWCPYQDYEWGLPDITHTNTVYYDAEDDSIYLMSRNTNTFWKISHSTGDVEWGLGQFGDFTLYDQQGHQRNSLFYHAHAVERVDDDTFILYDNDYHNQTDEFNEVSRIVEISIDEDTMTANTTWAWSSERDYYSFIFGDADRLPNRNRLGVFGIPGFPNSEYGARIVEVNEDHEIVWEMTFVNDETYWYMVYRNERFQFHPILQVLDVENSNSEGNITINFGAYFNYRPKRDLPGFYSLYIDDVLIEEGGVIFDRFWRPAIVSCSVPNPGTGHPNVTLIVWNGNGDSARITAEFGVTSIADNALLLFAVGIVGVIGLIILWKHRNSK